MTPPLSVSFPSPPFSVSAPSPPFRKSLPPRPFNVSLPPRPLRVLAAAVPLSVLAAAVPLVAAGGVAAKVKSVTSIAAVFEPLIWIVPCMAEAGPFSRIVMTVLPPGPAASNTSLSKVRSRDA